MRNLIRFLIALVALALFDPLIGAQTCRCAFQRLDQLQSIIPNGGAGGAFSVGSCNTVAGGIYNTVPAGSSEIAWFVGSGVEACWDGDQDGLDNDTLGVMMASATWFPTTPFPCGTLGFTPDAWTAWSLGTGGITNGAFIVEDTGKAGYPTPPNRPFVLISCASLAPFVGTSLVFQYAALDLVTGTTVGVSNPTIVAIVP